VLRLIPFVCMPSPIPRQDRWACSLVLSHRLRLFPDSRRVSSCITCFEACTAFIFITAYKLAKSPKATLYTRGFSSFVTSTTAPIATGWSEPVPGWDFSRCESAPFHGARESSVSKGAAGLVIATTHPFVGVSQGARSNTGSTQDLADSTVIERLMKRNLHGVFGESDEAKRLSTLAEIWASNGVFIDPHGRQIGYAAINEAVNRLHQRLPGFVFSEPGIIDAFNGIGRLAWGYGPAGESPRFRGIDVVVTENGRISALYTFLDPAKNY
jgi:hypothetical protein